jgi:hypothetical protein
VDHSHTEHLQADHGGWRVEHCHTESLQEDPTEVDFEVYLQLGSIEAGLAVYLLRNPTAACVVVCSPANPIEYCREYCLWAVHCSVRHLEVARWSYVGSVDLPLELGLVALVGMDFLQEH